MATDDEQITFILGRYPRRLYFSKRFGSSRKPLRFISKVADTPRQSALLQRSRKAPQGQFSVDELEQLSVDIRSFRIQYRFMVKEQSREVVSLLITRLDKRSGALVQIELDSVAVTKMRTIIGVMPTLRFPSTESRARLDMGELDEAGLRDELETPAGTQVLRQTLIKQLEGPSGADWLRTAPDRLVEAIAKLAQNDLVLNKLAEDWTSASDVIDFLVSKNLTLADVAELGRRKRGLAEFERLLKHSSMDENEWQAFFEQQRWIFGVGLDIRLLVGGKSLKPRLGGLPFHAARIPDAFLSTTSKHATTTLVEIKTAHTHLVKGASYRPELFVPSEDIIGGIAQLLEECQRLGASTAEETREEREELDNWTYRPHQTALVLLVGTLSSLDGVKGADPQKRAAFERFRGSIHAVKIITFDELYARSAATVAAIQRDLGARSGSHR